MADKVMGVGVGRKHIIAPLALNVTMEMGADIEEEFPCIHNIIKHGVVFGIKKF